MTVKNGPLPKGWREVQLGEFMEFKNGLNTRKENYGSGVKFVNVMDVFSHNHLYANDIIGSVQVTKKQLVDYSVKYGDVLFNRTSETFEEIAMSSVYLDKKEIIFGGFVIRGRQKSNILIPEYSAYCFQAHTVRRELIRRGQGAVRANIGQKDLSKIPMVIPPVNEQKAIASLLEKWDTAIEKTEALIEAKEKRFKWLITRLIAQRCKHWNHYKASELFKNISCKGYPDEVLLSVTQDRGVIPRNMLEGRVMSPTSGTDSYKLVEPGNFVISLRSFQGGLEYSKYRGIISPAYTVLLPKKKINDAFYRHFFKTYIFVEKYLALAVIGIRDGKQINFEAFKSIKLPLPSLSEQQCIAQILNTVQQETSLLKQRVKQYRTQQRGLMQKLLTGKWRISNQNRRGK